MKPRQRPILLARASRAVLGAALRAGWLVASAVALALPAQAQTIWRCDGGSRYSDRPCPEGTTLATEAPPDAARRQAAAVVAQRQIALAERLRAERLAREAAHQAALAPAASRHAPRQRADLRDAQGLPPARLSARTDPAAKPAQPQAPRPSRRARAPAADDRTSPSTARASR
jgi:hypothetical protein